MFARPWMMRKKRAMLAMRGAGFGCLKSIFGWRAKSILHPIFEVLKEVLSEVTV
jgi:hypothetical protein